MPPSEHLYDWPDRFVAGAVGEPGNRTFFLQIETPGEVVSVSLEKQQVAQLADKIDEVLDQLAAEDGNPFHIPDEAAPELVDDEPLRQPVRDFFRVGQINLGWDPSLSQIVLDLFSIVELDADLVEPSMLVAGDLELLADAMVRVRIPVGTARAFAQRAQAVVAAGRPTCVFCGEPMTADHDCALPDL
ncbi:MAG: DUF3090 domain-containing protein [Aeromicrobium sp.]|uniref:DUF3090 domain-containing protein n=1 Tax=Aeromicrobium sp. TaxID=1871063 RepID=UPI0039E28BBF